MKVNYIYQNTIKPTDKAFYLTPSIAIYTQYINKAAVVAEIEKLKKSHDNWSCMGKCFHQEYENLLSFLNTIEVKDFWKSADGDDLPEIDREVVAFQEIFPTDVDVPSLLKIVIAHRPNPEGYDGKSIATGKVEHYIPKTYDKGGWNIPNIVLWLDVDIPKLEED